MEDSSYTHSVEPQLSNQPSFSDEDLFTNTKIYNTYVFIPPYIVHPTIGKFPYKSLSLANTLTVEFTSCTHLTPNYVQE